MSAVTASSLYDWKGTASSAVYEQVAVDEETRNRQLPKDARQLSNSSQFERSDRENIYMISVKRSFQQMEF